MSHLVGTAIKIGTLYCCCYKKYHSQNGADNSAGDDRIGGGDEGGDGYYRMEIVLMVELQMGPKV